MNSIKTGLVLIFAALAYADIGTQPPNDLPDGYRTIRDWAQPPGGVPWAAVTAVEVAANGDVYVIEANPNPWLASRQEFAMAARASGLSYTEMIGSIIDLAMSRYLNANLVNAVAMH